MTFYSELEKKVISLIISFHSMEQYNCLFNILFDIKDPIIGPVTQVNIFHSKRNDTTIEFSSDYLNSDNARHIQIETVSKLYSVINLIKQLIEDGLLIFVKNNCEPEYRSQTRGFMVFDILDENLRKDLFDFDNGYLIPTYSLYQLVENNYKSPEVVYKEQRQEWQAEKYKELLQLVQNRADYNQKEMEKTTRKYKMITIIISIIAIIAPLAVAIISLVSTQKVSLQQFPMPITNQFLVLSWI